MEAHQRNAEPWRVTLVDTSAELISQLKPTQAGEGTLVSGVSG